MINPYEPPRNDSVPLMRMPSLMNLKTQLALVAISIAFGAGYQLIQNLRIASHLPHWADNPVSASPCQVIDGVPAEPAAAP